MPSLPHERLATCLLDFFRKRLRALHIEDDRLTLPRSLQNIAGIDDQKLVAPDDGAIFIHHSNAVSVAVERDAKLGVSLFDGFEKVTQVCRNGGIRMVIRKRSVAFAEKDCRRKSDAVEQLLRHESAGAIAAIHHAVDVL